ncbi:YjhG/YagF family D-xylonate dehydratase [Citrobacter amalonaticus]|uniref:YjhG/YagF family D-xylonate dehydratase n=1 Tax=Citrobacter amalonaticus TaxID=35703 RepID=UPI0007333D46|nr:YjhG/YagF family D-xylonate dehydratase [Citrobacter amalonaticus]EKX8496569.1 YjhG/YagF family D-xylonate dehydratase [Citrobacter amalonaticus]ELO0858046.1 YjhG/YagF family D-xylonate dehydratase [Citrobacter amalonaticus]PNP33312.1 YjhG/YagF family D-xylonate dehydratase [Citrobacter amalonaticus]
MSINTIFTPQDEPFYAVKTHAAGPQGALPLTPQMLLESPSGNLFGMTQNAGMGWDANKLTGREVLLIGTQGGIRHSDGRPIALGYHTGHWEIGLQMSAAAKEITRLSGIPFAAFVSDPCDGRSQGTHGMFDSLPYRNDAAIVFRRLIRSLPTRRAVIGVATCDKGLPATMIALASMHDLPVILVPGGATLPPTFGEDAGKVQTIGARYANNELSLKEASELGCRACASPGGGCQFLGTAGTSQVVAEALGLALPHSALAPSGQEVWLEIARQSARAVMALDEKGITARDILTDKAIENAMVVHAAFGGSTNLLLHIPAIAHAARCRLPDVAQWSAINRKVPRLVSVLPNGPDYHPTVRAFLAGGVPEVMLHLRRLGLLHEDVMTVTGQTLGENLDWWEHAERRAKFRQCLRDQDGVDPDDVILSPEGAKAKGMTSTVAFPVGNIAPEGSVIKATAIDPSVVDDDGVYRHTGEARVFVSEEAAIKAIKQGQIQQGDIMVIIGGGPSGTGMEETYQLTSALKHISWGKTVSLITDARFSGVSTGACLGHVAPEALAGGPIGKLRTGDVIEIVVDRLSLKGSVNFIGSAQARLTPEEGATVLAERELNPDLKPHDYLPDDTRLWAALQAVSGGTWKGCIYDTDKIIEVINAGKKALGL